MCHKTLHAHFPNHVTEYSTCHCCNNLIQTNSQSWQMDLICQSYRKPFCRQLVVRVRDSSKTDWPRRQLLSKSQYLGNFKPSGSLFCSRFENSLIHLSSPTPSPVLPFPRPLWITAVAKVLRREFRNSKQLWGGPRVCVFIREPACKPRFHS